ncbi:MAG: polysaccharide pyruvyl transferase family protein [Treponema sp.]|nr:polysaccharide pyruvyl transferase family protein [Treponema sp.]
MKNKKLGFITFHYNHNYGTALQTYALQYVINHFDNITAEIINFYYPWNRGFSDVSSHLLYKPSSVDVPSQLNDNEVRIIYKNQIENRFNLFESFYKKYYALSKPYNSWNKIFSDPPLYDIYISGGDQIWNTVLFLYDSVQFPYFLGFTTNPNKISYGTGMYPGQNRDNKKINLEFKTIVLLQQFKNIMVRDKNGADILKKYLNQPVDVVLDPTLLLVISDYFPLMNEPVIKINEPFIFIYSISSNHENVNENTLIRISQKYNKKIVLINSNLPVNNEYVITLIETGPSEWLWLCFNAWAVITNSFHGLAFSILFNKPFVCIGSDERKITLLDTLELTEYIVNSYNEMFEKFNNFNIDFTHANELLEKERKRCKTLLKEAIEMCK